jgi:hypothetical protein
MPKAGARKALPRPLKVPHRFSAPGNTGYPHLKSLNV